MHSSASRLIIHQRDFKVSSKTLPIDNYGERMGGNDLFVSRSLSAPFSISYLRILTVNLTRIVSDYDPGFDCYQAL